jgi:nucleoside-diphosphate-sugar epimerase
LALLITGATGLLGSHIAEKLVADGQTVRAFVRPSSDTSFLQTLGVELFVGNLTDPDACARATQGIDVVYHSAAKVGDWGRWADFRRDCIESTATLARAAAGSGVRRFVHISSTSAYGHPHDRERPVDETEPMGQNLWVWDPYTRSKVESENALRQVSAERKLDVTIIRPSWLYGERDRTTVARIVPRLRKNRLPTIGRGDNPLSAIYAGNVADAAILAAADPGSVGEAYNITNQGFISQRDFLNLFASACGARPVRRKVAYRLAYSAAFALEAACRLARKRKPPLITRYATWLMGRYLSYSTEKARTQLGWTPALGYEESIRRSVRWYLQ